MVRKQWASKHACYSDKRWNQVIFSDETKINLFGSDGRVYVRRKVGQRYNKKNLKPTVKHGGGSTWFGHVYRVQVLEIYV